MSSTRRLLRVRVTAESAETDDGAQAYVMIPLVSRSC